MVSGGRAQIDPERVLKTVPVLVAVLSLNALPFAASAALAKEGAPPPAEGPVDEAAPHQDDAASLPEAARRMRKETGCAAAAPTYRVPAGESWLTRAALAGKARAQRKLAMEMAAPASALHNAQGALGWSLVYTKNPTADLYGFGPLPPTLAPGLKAGLSDEAVAEAERFAEEFAPLAMAKFERPKRERKIKAGPPREIVEGRPRRRVEAGS